MPHCRKRTPPVQPRNRLRQKTDFRRAFNPMTHVQMPSEKYSCFCFPEIMFSCRHPASSKGRIAIVTTREAGSGGRGMSQCVLHTPTNGMART
jgi:transposase